ncbi:3-coathanger stack domain-containing protein [Emticicia agri]|uniref:Uncharacterized protein n=1 Tax=Emticicia agri TaxID=2492393 RepID=A0A4Q5M3E9_9BACT|nr:3-coathanger stack domain-containing protein [Emticicia agri]RYU96812.1 hypothetical protein EWM59_04605 [Emticicia agri]
MFRKYFPFIFLFLVYSRVASQTMFSEDSLRYYLNNTIIKIGFDKRMGGAVSYFARMPNGANLINNHDAGRQAGFETRIYPDQPNTWRPYQTAKYLTEVFPYAGGATREWNGLVQGSFYNEYMTNTDNLGGLPEEIRFNQSTGTLYLKAKLWEWGFVKDSLGIYKKIDAGAYNEYWVDLEGISAHFSAKQTRNIPYAVSNSNTGVSLNIFINLNFPFAERWYTYNESAPFTNQPVDYRTNIPPGAPNNENFWNKATENWVAMTNQYDFGMGIYTNDNRFRFLYGEKQFKNECPFEAPSCPDEDKYSFGTFSFSTYSFPCGELCTTPNNSTTLNFSFLAGTVAEIRQFAYEKQADPCVHSVILSSVNDDLSVNTKKKSRILIQANNTVSESSISYETGKFILLKPGFKVEPGASFSAKISADPCD